MIDNHLLRFICLSIGDIEESFLSMLNVPINESFLSMLNVPINGPIDGCFNRYYKKGLKLDLYVVGLDL